MDKTPTEQTQQKEFFEWFAIINAIAEKRGVSIYEIWNARKIWDYAYEKGIVAGLREAKEIAKGISDGQ